jgi:hypothetical protein
MQRQHLSTSSAAKKGASCTLFLRSFLCRRLVWNVAHSRPTRLKTLSRAGCTAFARVSHTEYPHLSRTAGDYLVCGRTIVAHIAICRGRSLGLPRLRQSRAQFLRASIAVPYRATNSTTVDYGMSCSLRLRGSGAIGFGTRMEDVQPERVVLWRRQPWQAP